MVEVEIGPGLLGGHHFEAGDAAPIDGGGVLDHGLHREVPREGRELLGHVVGHPGGGRRQRAPDGELHRSPSVSVSIT